MTTKETAEVWGISKRRVSYLCEQNRVEGATKLGNSWVIPKTAIKPIDNRIKSGNYIKIKEDNTEYLLKHFDDILLEFTLKKDFDGLSAKIVSINDEQKHLLPLDLDVSDDGILAWLKRRTIPTNRAYVENFLAKIGINEKDTKGIIDLCKGLSLNDCFWTPAKNLSGDFKQYNLYENRFSNTLALIAFTGYGTRNKSDFTSSPEFTTNGMLAKCWRRIRGDIVLYKSGTEGAVNTGKEPYSEYLSCQIAKAMELDYVDYGLSMWKGKLCSTCKLFNSIDISFIPIGNLVKSGGIRAVMEFYKSLGQEQYNKLIDMLVFDSIICNTDRHFGNFGVLVDNYTNKIIDIAPIFDNGLSLFCYALEDDMSNLQNYAKTRAPATYPDFIEFSKSVITKRQKDKLRHLLKFKFKKHTHYNMSDERVAELEKFVRNRASELLSQ